MTLSLAKVSVAGHSAVVHPNGRSVDLNELQRALARLDASQGPVARRNARAAVRKAMARITDVVDADFPAVKRSTKARKDRRTLGQIRKELIRKGWVKVLTFDMVSVVAALKLPSLRTRDGSLHPGRVISLMVDPAVWVPGWVAHYYPSKTDLVAARRSSLMIHAAQAAIKLGSLQRLVSNGDIECPTE